MVYSIKNSETGEFEYVYSDTAQVNVPQYDEETGEPICGQMKVRYRKHGHFHIPKYYLRGTICDEVDNVLANRYQCDLDITVKPIPDKPDGRKIKKKNPGYEQEDYIQMDGVSSNIILGYKRNSVLLFLIPTLFFYNFPLAVIYALLEIGLHMFAHHKNVLTMHKQLTFRSPLHVLTSQYCAICRTESDSKYNRIFDLLNIQMRNSYKSGTLKDISKTIG